MIKILIVEDQTMLREALEHLISEQDDMEVAGTTDDAARAPELCRSLQPDLVLMDVVTANNSNGISFAAKIREELPTIKIVLMTSFQDITFIDEARKAKIHSFMVKNTGNEHLFYVIRSTMKGIGIYPGPADISPFAAQFSEKEIAVIRLVCRGMARDDVVKELAMSESAIKQLIASILEKSGFDNIAQFAIYAAGKGLIVSM
ncbi:MAG: response regulator transcription factor [Treponema sp.]|nr:response regulator transcription factor [Treponema sp.]